MEPLQFSWQERHALPVTVILIALDRKRIRRGEGHAQHRSVMGLIVQSLQYRAGDCVTFEDFPKTRRSPPVHLVVAVMIGPPAIPRGLQDPAPQNPEAKPHEDVKVIRPDPLYVIVGEPVTVSRSLRLDPKDGRVAQQVRSATRFKGFRGSREHPGLKLAVGQIQQGIPVLHDLREHPSPARRERVVQHNQLNPGIRRLLQGRQHFVGPRREGEGIHQDAHAECAVAVVRHGGDAIQQTRCRAATSANVETRVAHSQRQRIRAPPFVRTNRDSRLVSLLLPPGAVQELTALSDLAGSPASGEARALDRSLLRGVAWTAAARWGSQGLTWIAWLIVARLLSPEDYGLVGMAAVYLGLVTLLAEFGLGTAVLADRELSREQLSQLNGLAVLVGCVSLLASVVAAFPLGLFFRAPQLPLVVVAMSATFVITSFKTVPFALLQRDFRFKQLALIDLGQAVVLAISMVGLAVAGLRYWTLVCGALLGALISTAAVLRLSHPRLAWPRPKALKQAMTLSFDVVIARVCWYVSANADFLVAGRVLGRAALGFYNVGWTMASVPVDRIAALVAQVTPAFFAAVQHDRAALRRYVLRITEGIALITFPLALGLALVARDFVLVVLGSRWEGTIGPLRLLAAYAAFRSIVPLLPQALQIIGDARFEMWRMAAAATVMPASFYVCGQRWGTIGLAVAWMFVDPVLAVPLYRRVFSKIALSPKAYLVALWPALSATALMAVVVLTVGAGGSGWTPGARLSAEIGAAMVTYGLACLVLHRERLQAFAELVVAARRGSEGRP